MKKITTGIVGAAGYAGQELLRMALTHPRLSLTYLADRPESGVEQELRHFGPLPVPVRPFDPDECARACRAVFLALPHEASMEMAPALYRAGVAVFDLSAAFRLRRIADYDRYYGFTHTAPDLLRTAVYGLPELNARKLRNARLVAVPGCYPTSAVLPLAPLLRKGWLKGGIIIDSKSGVTGAGRQATPATMFSEVNENFKAYAIFTHRHAPEIVQELSVAAGREVQAVFAPHLVPMNRGILTTIYATLRKKAGREDVLALLRTFYARSCFVRILDEGLPETRRVKGTNFCDVGAAVRGGTLVLVSAIDNLVKGAAGQALQAFNVRHGLPEHIGLTSPAGAP